MKKNNKMNTMDMMNMMSNINVTKAARVGIVSLATIMAMSCATPLVANAAAPYDNNENAKVTIIDDNQELTVNDQDTVDENQAVADENQTVTDENVTMVDETQAVNIMATVADGDDKDDKDDKGDKDPIVNPTDVTNWTVSIVKDDDKMKALLKTTEDSVNGIIKKVPELGYIAIPMLETIKVLYQSDQPETTLETISKKLEGIQGQIEDSKNTIIESMGTMSDMSSFMVQYNSFNSKYKEVSKQVSHISGYNMSQENKNLRLSEMVGKVSDWYSDDNLVFNHIALGSYLSGETKLVSGQKTIYDAMMDHYSHTLLFGKEAMDNTESLTADALAVYLESSTQLINCIIAKRNVLLAEGSDNSLCDADYCKSKISDMLNQIIKVNETLDAYKNNYSPYTLYDRTGDGQKNIVLSENVMKADFGKKKPMDELIGSKALSDAQLDSIVKYVKSNFPGKTVQEYLTYVGFNFSGKTYETYLAEYEVQRKEAQKNLDDAKRLLSTVYYNGMIMGKKQENPNFPEWKKVAAEETVKEMTEFLSKSAMTKDEYLRSCKVSDGAFLLTNRGRKNSTSMSTGTASDYYYKGVGLHDTNYKEKENHYLYISVGYKTNKRNEANADMYYLVIK